ncbi:hypothetical protein GCM10020358_53460 [Amorphoplanes nipponensis]|uniref:hypothetical protein n=1 Tax=Actinoplanes nipponensis TaxID=135950 RepID=UPI0031EB0CA6
MPGHPSEKSAAWPASAPESSDGGWVAHFLARGYDVTSLGPTIAHGAAQKANARLVDAAR